MLIINVWWFHLRHKKVVLNKQNKKNGKKADSKCFSLCVNKGVSVAYVA